MTQFRELPPLEELEKFFAYDPETGIFTNRVRRGTRSFPGSVAGAPCNGYVQIMFRSRRLYAHRMAWFMYYREHPPLDPKLVIDHIDTNRSNNRISNLRIATRKLNNENR